MIATGEILSWIGNASPRASVSSQGFVTHGCRVGDAGDTGELSERGLLWGSTPAWSGDWGTHFWGESANPSRWDGAVAGEDLPGSD